MKSPAKIWAVVPCAGIGKRMDMELPKQYLQLQGMTVIEHTLNTLLAEKRIQKIVVCIAERDNFWPQIELSDDPRIHTTFGCETRTKSVLNGINYFSDYADSKDWLLVHDAARPCLSEGLLQIFLDKLTDDEVGGLLAMQSHDTIKLAMDSNSHESKRTLDRDRIWYAQTPQMFRFAKLKTALERAIKKKQTITDEASAMELAGYHPKLIEGEKRNLKITRPEDIDLADYLLSL